MNTHPGRSLPDFDGPGDDELLDIDALNADAAPNPVDMVVFDLGNVLMRWDPMAALVPVVGEEAAQAFLSDTRVDFFARNLRGDAGESWATLIDEIASAAPEHREAAQAYFDHFEDAIGEPIAGTVEILRELSDAGVPLFALTNFNDELFVRTRQLHPFLDLFEEIIVSGEEGVTKPDAEIWEILEEVTRHVGGLSDAVFIDDSAVNVMGAEQAGIDAIQFTDPQSLRQELRLRGLPLRAAH